MRLQNALGFIIVLAGLASFTLSCAIVSEGDVPVINPPGGTRTLYPQNATIRSMDSWFLLFSDVMEYATVGSSSGTYFLGPSAPPTGETSFDIGGLGAGIDMSELGYFVFVDNGNRMVRVNTAASPLEVTTMLTSSLIDSSNVRLAANDTHLFVTGSSCVLAVDMRVSSGWQLVEEVGECGQDRPSAIVQATAAHRRIAAVTAIAWRHSEDVLGILTLVQLLVYKPSEREVDPWTVSLPDALTGATVMSRVEGGFVVAPRTGCSVYVFLNNDGNVDVSSVTDGTLCGTSSRLLALTPYPTLAPDGFRGVLQSSETSFVFSRLSSCRYNTSLSSTPGSSTATPPPTTPSPQGAALTESDSSSSNTIIIVVVVVVAVVLIAGIVAAALIVTRSGGSQRSAAAAGDEPAGDTMTSLPSTQPAVPAHGGHSGSLQATPQGTLSRSAGASNAKRVALSASQSAGASTQLRVYARQPSEMMSVSEEKRHLSQSAPNGVVVSAVSRGDFDRSMQDTDEGLKRKLGLRAWSDAELRRHNRRCAFVRESQYQRGKLLGRGANGSVYAVLLHDGSTIAMKEAKLMGDEDEIAGQMAEVENEMGLLSALHHDNLVTYYGVVCDESRMEVALFMENVTGGSLGALVRGMDATLPESTAQLFTKQMLRGLAYIHQAGIVHRDLKCDNVLRDAHTGTVKLADFGTAKRLGNAAGASRAAQTMIGTPYFMAPEILEAAAEEGEGYGSKADIWSIGILVAELLNRGNAPWPEFPSPAHAFMHILNKDNAPELPAGLSEHCEDFVRRCTRRDPRERPSAVELLEHPWILLAAVDSEDDGDDHSPFA